jgi:hypothetical protein
MQLAESLHQQAATGDEVFTGLCEEVPAAGLEGAGLQPQLLTQRHAQGLDRVQQLYPQPGNSASGREEAELAPLMACPLTTQS